MPTPNTPVTSDESSTEPPEENVISRSELSIEEQAAGSDDPMAQARAVLTDSEERFQDVTNSPEGAAGVAGAERRTSPDTVDDYEVLDAPTS